MTVFGAKDHIELFLYSFFGAEKNVFMLLFLQATEETNSPLNRFLHFFIRTWQHELQLSRISLTDLRDMIFTAMGHSSFRFCVPGEGHGRQIMAFY